MTRPKWKGRRRDELATAPRQTRHHRSFAADRRRRAVLTFISRYGTIIGLLAMIVFFSINAPGHSSPRANFLNILSQASLTAIIAAGLDLHAGGRRVRSQHRQRRKLRRPRSSPASWPRRACRSRSAIVLALAIGVAIGLINGIARDEGPDQRRHRDHRRRHDAVRHRLLLQRLPDRDGHSRAHSPRSALGRALFGVPNPVFIMVAVLIVLWTILNKTDIGQKMQAVGSNIEAARLSGIRVDRIKMFAFATAGFCAALTGMLLTSLLGSGTLGAADGYLLDAFAAVFLGSATLARRPVSHRRHADRRAHSRGRIQRPAASSARRPISSRFSRAAS